MSAEWTRFPIARLRYTKATRQWSLYWRDRHLASTSTTGLRHQLESRGMMITG